MSKPLAVVLRVVFEPEGEQLAAALPGREALAAIVAHLLTPAETMPYVDIEVEGHPYIIAAIERVHGAELCGTVTTAIASPAVSPQAAWRASPS